MARGAGGGVTVRLRVFGRVQGVGFRPAVCRAAETLGVRGTVRNLGGAAEIVCTAEPEVLRRFQRALGALPAPVYVESITAEEVAPRRFSAFLVAQSGENAPAPVLPADLGVCEDCLREMRTEGDPRHAYPFISCAQCGPRYTILRALPYDRARTTMDAFSMCPLCGAQYTQPQNRRCHGQTLSCPRCGPQLLGRTRGGAETAGAAAVAAARALLREGKLIAAKAVGGYQLLCRADSVDAVFALRALKHRPTKPLAVLFADMDALRRVCAADAAEEALLRSPARPIVLLSRAENWRQSVCESVAGEDGALGAFLPAAGLYALLADALPLVVTSCNRSGAPMLYEDGAFNAFYNAQPCIAGAFWNTREILRPSDDSVARVICGAPQILRRTRGYAPEPVLPRPPRSAASLTPETCENEDIPALLHTREGAKVVPEVRETGGVGSLLSVHGEETIAAKMCGKGNLSALLHARVGAEVATESCAAQDVSGSFSLRSSANLAPEAREAQGDGNSFVSREGAEVAPEAREAGGVDSSLSVHGEETMAAKLCEKGSVSALLHARGDAEVATERCAAQGECGSFSLRSGVKTVLAFGAQLEPGLCLAREGRFYPVAVPGDLDAPETRALFVRTARELAQLLHAAPQVVACDLHPLYATHEMAARAGLPLVCVQHHHAHAAAVIAEHGLTGTVLGVCFDGTGYGENGAVWGGEFLVCSGTQYRRAAHLMELPMLGGDASMRQGWKSALCHLLHAQKQGEALPDCALLRDARLPIVRAALDKRVNIVQNSSMGRLFDAVAAVLGLCAENTHEGRCAVLCEQAAARAKFRKTPPVPMDFRETEQDGALVFDHAPLFSALCNAADADAAALGFHRAVVRMVVRAAQAIGTPQVALAGGVFANRLLLEECAEALAARGFAVFFSRAVPPGDGSIALGQAYLAAQMA